MLGSGSLMKEEARSSRASVAILEDSHLVPVFGCLPSQCVPVFQPRVASSWNGIPLPSGTVANLLLFA